MKFEDLKVGMRIHVSAPGCSFNNKTGIIRDIIKNNIITFDTDDATKNNRLYKSDINTSWFPTIIRSNKIVSKIEDLKIRMRVRINHPYSHYNGKLATISDINDNGIYLIFDDNPDYKSYWSSKENFVGSQYTIIEKEKSNKSIIPLLALGLASGLVAKTISTSKASSSKNNFIKHEI